jgi:hypothetical protein
MITCVLRNDAEDFTSSILWEIARAAKTLYEIDSTYVEVFCFSSVMLCYAVLCGHDGLMLCSVVLDCRLWLDMAHHSPDRYRGRHLGL